MGVEFDEGFETVDCLLERIYADWHSTDEEKKKSNHRQFHVEKNIVKRWCQLVRLLSEGILVLAGNDVDVQMFEYCFPMKNMIGEADIGPATVLNLKGHTRWLLSSPVVNKWFIREV